MRRWSMPIVVVLGVLTGACTADTRPTAEDFGVRDRTATSESDATEAAPNGGERVRRAPLVGEPGSPTFEVAHDEAVTEDASPTQP